MDEHKKVFVEAKYEVSMAYGAHTKDASNRLTPKCHMCKSDQEHAEDLQISRRLLSEYLDLCNEYDTHDTILFGMEVTPGKIISSAGTVAMAVYTLLIQMMKNGAIQTPEVIE